MAARFSLDEAATGELLEDLRAVGLVTWSAFGDAEGWSLTDRGRQHGERLLAAELGALPRPFGTVLAGVLPRLGGYDERYAAALARVEQGERPWVDALGVDSCHTVWFQLHEDLLATLGSLAVTSRPD